MGSRHSNEGDEELRAFSIVQESSVDQLNTISVTSKLDYILCYWLRTLQFKSFPIELKPIIIKRFTYQTIFEIPVEQYPHNKFDYLCKIMMIGDHTVGKSSLTSRYVFDKSYPYTSLFPIYEKIIQCRNGKSVKFCFHDLFNDIHGRQLFGTITKSIYYDDCHGVIFMLCYDITSKKSLENIPKWNKEIDLHGIKYISKMVIGTKCDLEQNRQCQKEDVLHILSQCDGVENDVIETSAENDINVTEVLEKLANDIADCRMNYPFYG